MCSNPPTKRNQLRNVVRIEQQRQQRHERELRVSLTFIRGLKQNYFWSSIIRTQPGIGIITVRYYCLQNKTKMNSACLDLIANSQADTGHNK